MVMIELALNMADASNPGRVIGEMVGRLAGLALIIGVVVWLIVKLVKKPSQQGPPQYPYYPHPQWPQGAGHQQPYWQSQLPPPAGQSPPPQR